jgi:hypothetical protein
MKTTVRIFLSAFAVFGGFFGVFLILAVLHFRLDWPMAIIGPGSLVCATSLGLYTWRRTASASKGLAGSIVIGAVVTGGIGFWAGFFGPMILAPGANQGPLLGILITGPLGFVAGAFGGGVYWFAQRKGEGSSAERSHISNERVA